MAKSGVVRSTTQSGVCHLAGKFVERLRVVQRELFGTRSELQKPNFEISDKDALCLQVAGLCHDLGHGPLSHVFETYFIQKIGSGDDKKWTHETATRDILDYLWKKINVSTLGSVKLEEADLAFIRELIHKSKGMTADERETLTGRSSMKDFLYEIIANYENSIDVDKWDYYARDCYHLGFKNNFDHNRLIQFSRLIEVEDGAAGKRWHICYREKYDKRKFREEERKVEDEMSQLKIHGRKLNREDFLINILEFADGGSDNPVNEVYFYLKSDPDKAIRIERDQVFLLLPTVYREQVVRMYSRKGDEETVKQCLVYFETWCRQENMKGKWQLYATATTPSGPSQ